MAVKRGKANAKTTPQQGGFKGTPRTTRGLGWIPDLPDHRDQKFAVPADVMRNMQHGVDLRPNCPPIVNQGHIGSCTANAVAGVLQFQMMKQGMEEIIAPSRLFIYYNTRLLDPGGSPFIDSGSSIRNAFKSVASEGICSEEDWPYEDAVADQFGRFPDGAKATIQPSKSCYDEAAEQKSLVFQSVRQNLADMKGCLSFGYPFVLGFTVYDSFYSEQVAKGPEAGMVPMPRSGERALGGHAVAAVGYDDEDQLFICRNSWSDGWGDAGYFYMPYAYLIEGDLATDFWMVSLVE